VGEGGGGERIRPTADVPKDVGQHARVAMLSREYTKLPSVDAKSVSNFEQGPLPMIVICASVSMAAGCMRSKSVWL
jgi:hypothetical protein